MLSMTRFAVMLAAFVFINASAVNAAPDQHEKIEPSAMMKDQINATDQYAIPFDSSNIEEDEEEEEMEETVEKYQKKHDLKK